jgi:hypothetical protein
MNKTAVIVTGPGRSGTSLAMQALRASGLTLSACLKAGDASNPLGFFEDVEIAATLRAFGDALDLNPRLPRPADWRNSKAFEPAKQRLSNVVASETGRAGSVWGLKAPMAALFMPLFQDVFAEIGVTPKVVFCVREAQASIASMMRAADRDIGMGQGRYFFRCWHFLRDVRGPVYYLHYRDWIERPEETLRSLTAFCGLGLPETASAGEPGVFVPELDHSGSGKTAAVRLMTPVLQMERAIEAVRGPSEGDNPATALAQELADASIDDPSGGFCTALVLEGKVWRLGRKLDQGDAALAAFEELRNEVAAAQAAEDARLVAAVAEVERQKRLFEELVLNNATQKRRRAEAAKAEQEKLKASPEYRSGRILIEAFRRPFRKGLLLPFSLLRFYWRNVRPRKRAAAQS